MLVICNVHRLVVEQQLQMGKVAKSKLCSTRDKCRSAASRKRKRYLSCGEGLCVTCFVHFECKMLYFIYITELMATEEWRT